MEGTCDIARDRCLRSQFVTVKEAGLGLRLQSRSVTADNRLLEMSAEHEVARKPPPIALDRLKRFDEVMDGPTAEVHGVCLRTASDRNHRRDETRLRRFDRKLDRVLNTLARTLAPRRRQRS